VEQIRKGTREMKPHKHAEIIKAWADGAQIQQYRENLDEWRDCSPYPVWDERLTYRIKPDEPRLRDMYIYKNVSMGHCWIDKKSPMEAEMGTAWEYVGRIAVFK
jgi:hypothetical protein